MDDALRLAARLLIASLFVAGALQKLMEPTIVKAMLAAVGWPVWLVWPALALNAAGACLLILGRHLRSTALTLAAYCAVTSLFHFVPGDGWQMSIFIKNWAIVGGLLALATTGPGRFARA